jgi:hypothetical protein
LRRRIVVLSVVLSLIRLAGKPALAQETVGTQEEFQQAQEPQQSPAPNQQTPPASKDPSQPKTTPADKTPPDAPDSKIDSPKPKVQPDDTAQQTKRILGIIPNYRSVSANVYLPRQSFKERLWLATQDSFDYSAFVYVGMIAGISMAGKSEPTFGQGAEGYGKYYWHSFLDNGIENYMVEAGVPTLTKEDPRYYTLGKGGLFKRTGYAVSRLLITRNDSGGRTVNVSEIVGAGAAAGISNSYYPAHPNPWVKTYQRWISEVAQDGISNVVKEFWPDINRAIFHHKN